MRLHRFRRFGKSGIIGIGGKRPVLAGPSRVLMFMSKVIGLQHDSILKNPEHFFPKKIDGCRPRRNDTAME